MKQNPLAVLLGGLGLIAAAFFYFGWRHLLGQILGLLIVFGLIFIEARWRMRKSH